jgi:hypothetical protein
MVKSEKDIGVRVPSAILVQAQKTWGVKFYGSGVEGTRTGDAVGLVAGVGDDTNGTVKNDFDTQGPWSQIGKVDCPALSSDGTALGIMNKMGFIPQFYENFSYGTDSVGGYAWYQISNFPKEGFWPAFKNKDGTIAKGSLLGRYKLTPLDLSSNIGVFGSATGMPQEVNVSPSGAQSGMSYIKYPYLGATSVKQLLFGRTLQQWNAFKYLMVIEFATLNVQSIFPGIGWEGWQKITELGTTHNIIGTPTKYVSCATSNYLSSQSSIGSAIAIFISGNQWTLRTIIAKDADTDSNGAASGYTRLTISGDAVTLASDNIVNFNWSYSSGITDCISASSGNLTSKTDGLTGYGIHAFKYRGFENLYGGIWEFLGNAAMKDVNDGTTNKLTIVQCGSSGTLNTPSTYSELSGKQLPTSNGWQKLQEDDDGVLVPTELEANDSSYQCDYYWVAPISSAGTSYFEALVGAPGSAYTNCGPFSLAVDFGFGCSGSYFGGRASLWL